MGKGSGISRSDRRRNARRERLRGLLPRDGAVLGIDLGDQKQALALVDHDMRVLWRRNPRCAAHQLGGPVADAVIAAAAAGFSRVTVACEPTGPRWMQVQRLCREAGVALVCVQPLVSHIARGQEDYTAHKRDEPDAVLIARLAAELHCYIPGELDETWACLRQPGRRRAQLTGRVQGAGRRVQAERVEETSHHFECPGPGLTTRYGGFTPSGERPPPRVQAVSDLGRFHRFGCPRSDLNQLHICSPSRQGSRSGCSDDRESRPQCAWRSLRDEAAGCR